MGDIEGAVKHGECSAEEQVGRRVGHIKIVGKLGFGGFGTVYEGFDEALGRRVALKAIHGSRLSGDARARLQREARILSRLEDPKICRIHEYARGEDSDYLVLERVEGKTLQDILREEPARLSFKTKLRIAEQLLEVLVRTHAEGVVHRDLKPSNLMLTRDDQLKVLDFGIALVDEAETPGAADATGESWSADPLDPDRTVLETRRGRVMGTASYLSPEQARGERATPASDMYSLGLVLQELFTGVGPHPRGLSAEQLVARAVLARTEPVAGLSPDLTRLIEALKSGAASRRPTAAEARQTLGRILDKPRRRQRWLIAAAAFLLLASAGIAHTIRLERERDAAVAARERAEDARHEAVAARAEAQQVVDFLTGLFAVSDPSEAQGRTITADELLRRGAARIKEDLADQPLVRARLEQTIGSVYRELGSYDEAERFLSDALALRRAGLGAVDPAVAESLRSLGELHTLQARYDEAEGVLREALAIDENALGKDHLAVAANLQQLAELARQRGKWPEAEAFLRRVLLICELHPDQREALGRALSNLAGVYWRLDRFDDAEPLMRRALAIDEELLGPDDPRLARTLNNLGLIAQQRRQQVEAEAYFRRALTIKEKTLGTEHPELASTVYNIGISRRELGDARGALAYFNRALTLDENAHGPDHPNVAFTLTGLGTIYRDLGRLVEAETAYRRALVILDRTLPDHPARTELLREWDRLKVMQAGVSP